MHEAWRSPYHLQLQQKQLCARTLSALALRMLSELQCDLDTVNEKATSDSLYLVALRKLLSKLDKIDTDSLVTVPEAMLMTIWKAIQRS
jgi:hypothetical protein